MTHQSPKTHRDPPEPRLLDDGFLDEGPRVPFTGWALDDPPPVAPITRRAAFVGFVVCAAVLAAVVVLLLATPRTAGHVIPAADRWTLPRVDGWSASGNLDRLSPAPSGAVGTVLLGGTLSYVSASYGPEYLALPFPRGTVAEICGPGGCVTRRSTDFGPDQRVHPDRVADLSAADFVFVCDAPLSAGLCKGTVELEPPVDPADDAMRLEDRPLPATSTQETP